MYPKPRAENYDKQNPRMRWALPDRVFFACGACHILAYAFLERYAELNAQAIWIKPKQGYSGNHIFISYEGFAFDYHGYSSREDFDKHLFKRARHYQLGWDADFIELPKEVLISEAKSKTYEGLWLREPNQFLHDALPRARNFLSRFQEPRQRLNSSANNAKNR